MGDSSSSPRLAVGVCDSNLHRLSPLMLLLTRELRHHFPCHIDRDGRIPSLELPGGTFSRGLALQLRRIILGEGKRWKFVDKDGRRECSTRGRGRGRGEATSPASNDPAATIYIQ